MSGGPYDSRAIANEILSIAEGMDKKLTVMQLTKLVYLAHGWSLALLKRPLTANNPQAWQYGPVYPHVYKSFKKYQDMHIRDLARDKATGQPYVAFLKDDEKSILSSVVSSYGDMHAFQLSDIMHRENTPWKYTIDNYGLYKDIPQLVIQEHFERLAEQRNVGDQST